MKNNIVKKLFLILFLMGFLFSTFGIGKIIAEEPTFILSNAVIDSKSTGVDANIVRFDNDELVTNTTFHALNDYVAYILTIKNTSDTKYKLVLVNDNNSSNNVVYEYEYNQNEDLLPGSSVDVLLKITYKNENNNMNNRDQNLSTNISFIMEDENGNVVSGEVTHNPKTGDNIYYYICTLVISIIGLAYVFRKKISKLFVFLMLMIPFITYALTASLTVISTNNIELYDKVVVNNVINGETVPTIVDYNSVPNNPGTPQIDGYTFDNWYLGNGVYNFDTPVTEDTEIEARFNVITYNITYDLAGGSVSGSNPDTYNVETDTFDLINPTLEGYTFAGWTEGTSTDLQTRVTINKGTTGDKTFTAHFSPNPHTAYQVKHKYKTLTGTFEVETENLSGPTGEIVTPAFKPKTGFNNPTSQQQLTILPSGDAYIEYVYERKLYQLTLENAEDIETEFNSESYPFETEITLTAKSKEHYDFEKWSNDETTNPLVFNIDNDTTISPIYKPKQYTVSFNTHGGVEVDAITKDYNQTISSLPSTVKDDYVFDGWYTEETGGTKVEDGVTVTGNVTYHAHWSNSVALATVSPNSITITRTETETISVTNVGEEYSFSSSNGSIASVDNNGVVTGVAKGTAVITITGTKSGKTKTVNVTVNPIMYTVTYETYGGSSVASQEYEENSTIATLPTTTKDNYNFVGWYTEETDGTKVENGVTVTGNVTYHAHWSNSVALATVSPNSITITRTETETISVTNVGEEYSFSSSNGSIASVDNNGVVTGVAKGTAVITITGTKSGKTKTVNVTVNPIMYTVTYETYGGSSVASQEYEENSTIATLPTTTKDNYNFVGWYTEETDGTKVENGVTVTGNVTYHAHWVEKAALICKKATTLHTESCLQSSGTGCRQAGYAENDIITYGQLPVTVDLLAGDAYDCDVDGNGVYDAATERFYYIRTIGDNAALVSHTNYESTKQNIENNFQYPDVEAQLPPTTKWINLPITFDDNAARLPSIDDLKIACNKTVLSSNGSLDSCQFFMENSRFSSASLGRTGVWLKHEDNLYRRYLTTTRAVATMDETSYNVARPVIEVPLENIERTPLPDDVTITFDSQGGSAVDSVTIPYNTAIGTMPEPDKENFIFLGWFTDTNYNEEITGSTLITHDMELVASWLAVDDSVAAIGTTTYDTLPAAFAASVNNTETTIRLLKDVELSNTISIASAKNVILNLNGNNITTTNGKVFDNSGILTIKNTSSTGTISVGKSGTQIVGIINHSGATMNVESGTITSNYFRVMDNDGTLNITGGSFTIGNVSQGVINNNAGGVLNMSGGEIIVTKAGTKRQAIYNKGTANISGTAVLTSASVDRGTVQNDDAASVLIISGGTITSTNVNCQRGAVHNASGRLEITGGTITSNSTYSDNATGSGPSGVQNAGTLIIGNEDGNIDTTSPVIQGKIYGINSSTNYSFYDGVVKGITAATNDDTKITGRESGYTLTHETEESYDVLHYDQGSDKHKITLNANGGTVSPTYIYVDDGDSIGTIPTPEKGIYTFDGWYLDSNFEDVVPNNYIPTGDKEIFAKWSYASSNNIVNFNTTNDVMTEYYNHISTWKQDESSFQTNMKANFDAFGCKCKDNTCTSSGTVSCDKPKAYDTGVGESVSVYLSNESTLAKGDKVEYTLSDEGVIYNMIPGQTYYWELDSDSNVYGYVKASGNRRILDTAEVGNTRDLGGLHVDTDGNGTVDGTLKYGILFRGEKIGTSSNGKSILESLGINEEVDLRASSERASNELALGGFKQREIKHYQIDPEHYLSNYNTIRSTIKEVMQDVVDDNKIFFHCRIGADRTGTLAYILEGLLGVVDEDRLQDYELTVFSGLINRHRYYSVDPSSSVSTTEKFMYMYDFMENNTEIYNWFISGASNQTEKDADDALISQFRSAMIQSN